MFYSKKCCMKNLLIFLCFLISFFIPSQLTAQDGIEGISLGELLNLEITTATKTALRVSEAPSIVSVITANEIYNMGARNIMDVLKTVPGFDIVQNTLWHGQILAVRGIFNSNEHSAKVKFMMNGHPLRDEGNIIVLFFEDIPIHNVKQIEIIRGPGSALYGAGAFIGIINIITKNADETEDREADTGVSVSYGSFNTSHGYTDMAYKHGDFKTYFFTEYYNTDGPSLEIESDASTIFARDLGLSPASDYSAAPGDMNLESARYNFNLDMSCKNFSFFGFLSKSKYEDPVGPINALGDESPGKELVTFGELQYVHPLSDKGNLTVKAFYDFSRFENHHEVYSEETTRLLGFPEGEGVDIRTSVSSSETGGEITLDYELIPELRIISGALYEYSEMFDQYTGINANAVSNDPITVNGKQYPANTYLDGFHDVSDSYPILPEESRHNTALYCQLTADIKEVFSMEKGVDNLTITGGLRYDHYNDFGDTVNPRIGLVYAPTEKVYFKALYGTAFRAPMFTEMYIKNNPSLSGNPELKPEKIATLEGLVGFNVNKNIRSTLTFFHTRVTDLIQTKIDGTILRYLNYGEMISKGVEGELRIGFGKNKYGYFNITWQDVKDVSNETISNGTTVCTQEDFNPGGVPSVIANMGLNYDFADFINANVYLNYMSKRERRDEKEFDAFGKRIPFDSREPVESRFLVNATLTFTDMILEGTRFQISCYNLLDEDYREPDFSRNLEKDVPTPGRSFMAKISYSF
ncbi:MAG: TonB-dependent receptor [Desulfobacterales bacterium]|nr:TonB-dependent receptor [Desulfobacterales bacterium]